MDRETGVTLIDSGCSNILVDQEESMKPMLIKCVHGHVKSYERVIAMMEVNGQKHTMRVGVVPNMPYGAVIGGDWPYFYQLLTQAGKEQVLVGQKEETEGFEYIEKKAAGSPRRQFSVKGSLAASRGEPFEGRTAWTRV